MNFIKARYRRMGVNADGLSVIDIGGLQQGTIIGVSIGTAYALRDALSAALDDFEKAGNP